MPDDAFVVIDEKPGGGEGRLLLLDLVELNGAGDGVGGTASELALIVHWRTSRPQVDALRQRQSYGVRRA